MKNVKNEMISTQRRGDAETRRGIFPSAPLRLCVKTLRAVGDALWLLWMLPGILVAACSASAEEEHDERLKAIDGGAL